MNAKSKAAEGQPAATTEYQVAEGVAWINGRKVPASGRVVLTDVEAAFDKGLGRITPVAAPKGKTGGKTTETPAE